MNRIIRWLTHRVVSWFQKRCDHDPEHVSFDILGGSHEPTHVQFCHRCGAVCVRSRPNDTHYWLTVSPGTFP